MLDLNEPLIKRAYDTIKFGKIFNNPKMVILMGLPGSGKSYTANYLNCRYGFTVISGENISNSLFTNDQNIDYSLVYKTLRQIASCLLEKGYSVVIDGTNLKYSFRQQIYDEVCSKKNQIILINLLVEDNEAMKRIKIRGENRNDNKNIKSNCSLETYNKFKNQAEPPKLGEPFYNLKSNSELLDKVDRIISKFL